MRLYGLLLIGYCCIFSLKARAQAKIAKIENRQEVAYYLNLFDNSLNHPSKKDSLVVSLRTLLGNGYTDEAFGLIQRDLAQCFIQYDNESDSAFLSGERRVEARSVLNTVLADSNKIFIDNVRPLYCLLEVQDAISNEDSLRVLTDGFITNCLFSGNQDLDRSVRYGLMIYQVLSKHPHLEAVSQRLLTQIENRVQQDRMEANENSSDENLKKRAWFRYYLGFINYLKADRDTVSMTREGYLKLASAYSPDQNDDGHTSIMLGYDRFFFHPYKTSFKTDYIDFLIHDAHQNKSEVLSTISDLAVIDPTYKDSLKSFYNTQFPDRQGFDKYWEDLIDSKAKNVPPLEIELIDHTIFSSKKLSGKWIYLDFWATWCGPCREEHPGLQKFYDSVVSRNPDKITVLAIGCQDDPAKIKNYIKENKYSFPVAIALDNIKDIYAKAGFPGKALITPDGKCIPVSGGNWEFIIEKYCGLDK